MRAIPVLVTVAGLCAVFPRTAPRVRHSALAGAFVACLLLPAATSWLSGVALPVLVARPGAAGVTTGSLAGAMTTAALGGFAPTIGSAAIGTWLAVASFLALRLAVGLVGAGHSVAEAIRLGRVLRVGPGGRTRVVISSAVTRPMAMGLLRPVVLLPVAARAWTREERRAVLRHEFAHVRRGDGWTLLLSRIVRTLHWFNPLVWLTASMLRSASEEACDEIAAAEMPRLDYADLLLRLARHGGPARTGQGSPLTFAAESSRLGIRIRRLTEGGSRPVRRKSVAIVASGVTAVAMLSATARPTFTNHSATSFAARYRIEPGLARQVLEAAGAERVSLDVAFGLVSVESDFDAARLSSGGAVGLAQVLPSTATALYPGLTPDELWRPETNLRLGFRLLRGYLDDFAGDLELALLAYAAGPRAAKTRPPPSATSYPARVLRAAGPNPSIRN